MARTPVLGAVSLAWARQQFGTYYSRAHVPVPQRLSRREFAMFPFSTETLMRRHTTLRTSGEFSEYLRNFVPRHAYYSSAYYHEPQAPTMAAKGWMGADLIFDLDSDHLRGAPGLGYADQLALVKSQLMRLLDDFLARDFGIEPPSLSISFSGGRGYHVHIHDGGFAALSSPDRRELVDYIMGVGSEPERAIRSVREHGDEAGEADGEAGISAGRGSKRPTRTLAPEDSPGWIGRSSRALVSTLRRWIEIGPDRTRAELVSYGLSRKQAAAYSRRLIEQDEAAKILRSRKADGSYSIDVKQFDMATDLLRRIATGAAIQVQGETDAPVTTDVHRLIRLPGSLHGGTGFRVVPLGRDDLKGFDPFRDAIAEEINGPPTRVTFLEDVDYPFQAGGVRGRAGASDELPTPVALFLVLRQEAELPPSPA